MVLLNNARKSILVTGATGYIGSHTVLELLNAGFRVIAIANSNPAEKGICVLPQCLMRVLVLANCKGSMLVFRRCNLQKAEEVEKLFNTEHFSAVIHLASSKGVAPSIAAPLDYYANNLISAINLLKMCEKYDKKKFIFMSSATVYGVPKEIPVTEKTKTGQDITNPYGWSKHMVEQMLWDASNSSKDWSIIILRAFDPAGAHPSGLLGEDINSTAPKHLMPLIASVAMGKLPAIRVCGNSFPTRDGSGSRDFVHVVDVARAILLALKRIEADNDDSGRNSRNGGDFNAKIDIYNLGLGFEHTVLEMIACYEKVCGKTITKIMSPARPGDIATIYCDISSAKNDLNWTPEYGVEQICEHLHNWYLRSPNGYN